MTTPNPFQKIEDLESGEYLRRRLNPKSLQPIKKFQQSDYARQAQEQREQDPRNPFDVQQQLQTPAEPPKQKKKGAFAKFLDAISFTGDLSAGAIMAAFPSGGLLEEETEDQIRRGGSGTDEPLYKRLRRRRAELLNIDPNDPWGSAKYTIPFTGGSWIDYAKATRQAYIEAKDDKELEFGAALGSEMLLDPLTYTGFGIAKGYKAGKAGVNYIRKGGKITDTAEAAGADDLFKNIPFSKAKSTSEIEMRIAGHTDDITKPENGLWGMFKRRVDKMSDYIPEKGIVAWNSASDRVFGRARRYLKQNKLTQAILRKGIRESDSVTQGNIAGVSFKNSGRTAKLTDQDMDDVFENFFKTGFSPILKIGGKIIKNSNFKDIYKALGKKFPKEFKISATKDGKLHQADFIAGMFTKPIRVIVKELRDDAKVAGSYLDEFSAADLKKYVRFDDLKTPDWDAIVVGAAHAMGQLAHQRNLLKKAGLTIADLFTDIKVSKSVRAFLDTIEMEQVYFPHELMMGKTFDDNLKKIWEIKTSKKISQNQLKEIENIQKARNLTSETISSAIVAGKLKFNHVSTALTLQKRQIDTLINNQKFIDEIGEEMAGKVNVLDNANMDALENIVNLSKIGKLTGKAIKALDNKNTQHLYKLLSGLSKSKRVTSEDVAEAVGRRLSTKDSLKSFNDLDELAIREKLGPKQLKNVFFRDENHAKQIAKEFNLNPEGKLWAGIRGAEQAANVMRQIGTGLDFSWHMLQGLVTLGAATVINPRLLGVYASSMKHAALAFADKSNLAYVISKMDPATVRRATTDGNLRFTQEATDTFAGMDRIGKIAGGIENFTGKFTRNEHLNFWLNAPVRGIAGAYRGAQRAFNLSGDVIKLKGYALFEPIIESQADDIIAKGASKGLSKEELVVDLRKQMGSWLMKATGGIDAAALGLPASQMMVERAFLFFSPSYTRASLSLIASVRKGGMEGALARQSLLGLAFFGHTVYVVSAAAAGQEPKLDPTRGDFMTLRIGDSDVGFGGFYRSFLTFLSRSGDDFSDKSAFEEAQGRTIPLISWAMGRTSPATSIAWDIVSGTDALGSPIERNLSGYIGKEGVISKRLRPFWAENVMVTDPLTGNWTWNLNETGLGVELLGLRAVPIDVFDEKRRVQDELAEDYYGKKWNDLSKVERLVLTRESEYLKKLVTEATRVSSERGTEVSKQLKKYFDEKEIVLAEQKGIIEEGVKLLDRGVVDPAGLRNIYITDAADIYYDAMSSLRKRTEEGDLNLVAPYWAQVAGDKENLPRLDYRDDVLDAAYEDYLTNVVLNPDIETVTGETDWYARDEAIKQFVNTWENKGLDNILNYVKARTYAAKDFPPIVSEYYSAKDYFSYYWKETERAVLGDVNERDALAYKRWKLEPNEVTKKQILKDYPGIRTISSQITGAKKELRKIDKALDGFLYRWGYTTTFEHIDNKNKEDVWKYPTPFTLEEYQGSV